MKHLLAANSRRLIKHWARTLLLTLVKCFWRLTVSMTTHTNIVSISAVSAVRASLSSSKSRRLTLVTEKDNLDKLHPLQLSRLIDILNAGARKVV